MGNLCACHASAILSGSGSGSGSGRKKSDTPLDPTPLSSPSTPNVNLLELIGKGGFANVYRGINKNTKEEVAVKICCSRDKESKSWSNEVEIYKENLAGGHPNIAKYIGSDVRDIDGDTQLWITLAYYSMGSVYDYLLHYSPSNLEMMRIISSLVEGLEFLHVPLNGDLRKPAIAHRDLKSQNILLKANGECAIADLGLSIYFYESSNESPTNFNSQAGTVRFMAPEVLDGRVSAGSIFPKFLSADIYSLGVTMAEILFRWSLDGILEGYKVPFFNWVDRNPSKEKMSSILRDNRRPLLPRIKNDHWASPLAEIIEECWCETSDSRPFISVVKNKIQNIVVVDSTNTAFQNFYQNRNPLVQPEVSQFHSEVPKENGPLPDHVKAWYDCLLSSHEQLLRDDEFEALQILINRHEVCINGEEGFLNYENFLMVGSLCTHKCKKYFNSEIFAELSHQKLNGEVHATFLSNYISRKERLLRNKIRMLMYADPEKSYLRKEEFKNYLFELIPKLRHFRSFEIIGTRFRGIETRFRKLYICFVVGNFFFFLDPNHTGCLQLKDILCSGFLDELIELKDRELYAKFPNGKWFSQFSLLRILADYLKLDKNGDRKLSKEELASYGTGSLTNLFIERVFQEYGIPPQKHEMNFKTYVDFVLAMENRHTPGALSYFFPVLDVEKKGYLDTCCLKYFFEGAQDSIEMGQEIVPFENIRNQIINLVQPDKPDRITLNDLLHCKQGGKVVTILIDLRGFQVGRPENGDTMAAVENTNK